MYILQCNFKIFQQGQTAEQNLQEYSLHPVMTEEMRTRWWNVV